jgi:hypothetical protein
MWDERSRTFAKDEDSIKRGAPEQDGISYHRVTVETVDSDDRYTAIVCSTVVQQGIHFLRPWTKHDRFVRFVPPAR